MLTPEQIIEIFGGPAVLSIKYVRIVLEAKDRGEKITQEEAFSKIASQIGAKPVDVANTLQKFWNNFQEL